MCGVTLLKISLKRYVDQSQNPDPGCRDAPIMRADIIPYTI